MKATSYQGLPPLKEKFGPFASEKEALAKKIEQEHAVGRPGYEYEYRIGTELVPPL